MTIEVGSFVEYKNKRFIVTAIIADKAKILSPVHSKYFVNMSNLTYLPKRGADTVMYRGSEYLVTPKDLIISLETHKIMKWREGDGNRNSILALRDSSKPVPYLVEQAI